AHNPKVAGSNPAPATSQKSNGSLQDLSRIAKPKPANSGLFAFLRALLSIPRTTLGRVASVIH
ncbi:MAG: hypothetical protein ACLFVM_15220, partial [Ralstonia sp.]